MAFQNVRARLARLLVDFAEMEGHNFEVGRRIRIALTQDEMAHALAVTRRAVSKEFSRWQEQELVGRVDGFYVVRNLDKLRQEGGQQLSNLYSAKG
jgi:CRP-like cAMP-binding protein